MRESILEFDWEATPLGPATGWPVRLRVIVDLMLDSAEPMVVWWGPDRLQIYNDAYAPRVCGKRGSSALGRPAADTWKHGWAKIEPFVDDVLHTATSRTYDEFAFSIEREGKLEEAYWTYSLTPIRDDANIVQGVLVLSNEITEQVLLARRQQTLDVLRNDLAEATTFDQLAAACARAAVRNRIDLHDVKLMKRDAAAVAGPMPHHVRAKARDVGIDVGLAIDFIPSPEVALDDRYRIFSEQFCLLIATAQQRIESEARRRMTEAERDRLLLDAPVGAAVMLGENLVYRLVNSMYAAVSGRPAEKMVNKPFVEVYPELLGSPVHEKFKEVFRSGEPFVSEPTLVQIHRNGGALDDRYFTYNLSPLRTLAGEVSGLMVIAVDITTEVESRSHVERLNVELNAAARAKDEFLAMLAHELRNPLAPIGAAAELLQIMTLDEQRVRQTSQVIGRQVRHMTALVDDLLDVSRLTRGLVDLELAPLDIRHVVADAVEQLTPLIQSRRHRLALHLPPDTTTVSGDKKRLVQVVANILNNAAKYTPEGGSIVLRVDVHPAHVAIEVEDNGIGMEPGLASRAFDLFAQAERTPDRSSGGLGLGLALVKSLTELHGGRASCRSPGLGKGSTFSVYLPRRAQSRDEPDRPHTDRAAVQETAPLRILVVDDNVDAASMIAMLLDASGHQVTVEHSSRRALERARQEAPPVCILDIGLPEMDGIELAKRLRASPETADALLIAVTGYGQDKDREQTRAAGFDHHLVKPVDIKQLLGILADFKTA
ncbi:MULTISPECIES: ATP-binding protein [unclassified Massilia]|uniref:hybrid sensor histidine kinase/response regulator n=1 Tax=unclassified Massilia TaxID=2609279 RepID=UPI0017870CD8|nr:MULTISPECIES: ATP-binding protein [unclassified Massilia]MBD8531458.1 PAS domain-containing protein [Massilia sp. CFBP 13647]MBD8673746.1 PAS domain-containing protein [Massilia sp. CFBP 13721]